MQVLVLSNASIEHVIRHMDVGALLAAAASDPWNRFRGPAYVAVSSIREEEPAARKRSRDEIEREASIMGAASG